MSGHKPDAIILLEALLEGQTITAPDGTRYMMAEDGEVVIPMTVLSGPNKGEEIYVHADLTLQALVNMGENMSFKDLFIISSNTALRRIHKREERGMIST